MGRMMTAKMPKKSKGINYVGDDERYDRSNMKKDERGMKTAGLAIELKESQNEQGYSNKPKVKGQKKNAKPVSGKKKVY